MSPSIDMLDAERDALIGRWRMIEPLLDASPGSVEEWGRLREQFFTEHGAIPCSVADRTRLEQLKDKYVGNRCFVIGNGPSLNRTPLHLLKNEFTFGVNRFYLMHERLDWQPTFYTANDWRVVLDCAEEINALQGSLKFLDERFHGLLVDSESVHWYWHGRTLAPGEEGFSTDASLGIRGAGSVVGSAIQLAYHMGFDPIYLIGVDVSYAIPSTVKQEGPDRFGNGVGLYLTSTEDDDANHFDRRYFGTGRKWHDPNVKRMIEGFEQCQKGVVTRGRSILNATVGGQLEVFPRVEIRDLFSSEAASTGSAEATSFIAALLLILRGNNSGLALEIGVADSGASMLLAASGVTTYICETHDIARARITENWPRHWPVFIDPREVDAYEYRTPIYRHGGDMVDCLAQLSASALELSNVNVASLQRVLEVIPDVNVDVLAISLRPLQRSILDGWPWDEVRPPVVTVSVDDDRAPAFGFDFATLAELLESKGYQVWDVGVDSVSPWRGNGTARSGPRLSRLIGTELTYSAEQMTALVTLANELSSEANKALLREGFRGLAPAIRSVMALRRDVYR